MGFGGEVLDPAAQVQRHAPAVLAATGGARETGLATEDVDLLEEAAIGVGEAQRRTRGGDPRPVQRVERPGRVGPQPVAAD